MKKIINKENNNSKKYIKFINCQRIFIKKI